MKPIPDREPDYLSHTGNVYWWPEMVSLDQDGKLYIISWLPLERYLQWHTSKHKGYLNKEIAEVYERYVLNEITVED